MSEKTLLVELEKDKEKLVEKKLAQAQKEVEKNKELKQPKKEGKRRYFNAFSSKSFKGSNADQLLKIKTEKVEEQETELPVKEETVSEEQELARVESKVSQVIEKPNYDYMETLSDTQREKIFKIEKTQQVKSKTKPSKLKVVIISILFAIFGVWGVVNIAQIDNIGSQISQAVYNYELNLPKYLSKLMKLDATSSKNMENLFETIPEEDLSPSQILEKSNWFDRFCNFIAGLFGG